jgi:tRNA (guanine37-N1)-methyltransferase
MSRPVPRIVVVSIFPEMVAAAMRFGVIGRAIERGELQLDLVDLRSFADPPHFQVDDAPFGGGAGMVFKPEPLFRSVDQLRAEARERGATMPHVVLLDPAGRRFDQAVARDWSRLDHLVLLCGRYEGVDDRVRQHCADEVISIGDYVLSGGELAAMVVIDAVGRLLPGVVGAPESLTRESFEGDLLDHPQYTRPAEYLGHKVPEVLLSGNHAQIARWRSEAAKERTTAVRPDLAGDSGERTADVAPSGKAGLR